MGSVNLAESKTNILFSFFQVSKLKYHCFDNKNNVDIVENKAWASDRIDTKTYI